jgi:putative ABC transport system ATP-binding protein
MQRVAIARALIMNPPVILADEPTGNLDSKSGLEILRLLRAASVEKGRTIVMVTHDARAAAHGHEIIELKDGEIVARRDVKDGAAA